MTGGKFRSKIVDDFLSNFTSSSTIRGYRCHLKCFFDVIGKDPDAYITDTRRLENGERLDVLEDYERDVKKFWKWMIKQGLSPKTISNGVGCLRVFFKQYRIQLDEVVWENMRRRGPGCKPITEEMPLTRDMLKKLLIHGDSKAKSLFLVMSSSGMRVAEVVQLKLCDVDFESKPTKIFVRYDTTTRSVKNKSGRITFISDEAKEALLEWLKQRDNALLLSTKRTNFPGINKNADDDRIFPWRTSNVRKLWNNLLEKADLDGKDTLTDRRLVHPHSLRKYFRTQMSRQNRDIAEVLMGHEGYLGTYRQFTEEELKEEYLEGMKYLYVFQTSTDSAKIKELQDELDKTKEKLDKINAGLLSDPEFRTQMMNMMAEEWEKLQQEKK